MKGELTDYLKLTVGAFVYSVGLPPAWAEGCAKAIEIMTREPERVRRLQDNALLFKRLAGEAGLDIAQATGAAVVPVLVGNSIAAVMLSERLFARGFNVLPIIHPAVAPNAARLRFFLTSEHTEEDIRLAVQATAEEVMNLSGASSLIDKVEGR